jgi:hypothetical protein
MNIPNFKYLIVILVLLVLAMVATVNAQNKMNVGVDMSMQFCGNGTGGTYSPGLFVSNEKNYFNVGVNFQTNNSSASGLNATYRRTLCHESESFSERTTLYMFSTVMYHHNASIGKTTQMVYSNIDSEFAGVNKMSYCIAEFYAGAGISQRFSKRSALHLNLGAGAYHTVKCSTVIVPDAFKAYRSDTDISLFFKVGYSFKIN